MNRLPETLAVRCTGPKGGNGTGNVDRVEITTEDGTVYVVTPIGSNGVCMSVKEVK